MKYGEFIRKIKKQGWVFLRQGKGSHEIYEKDGKKVTIPNHGSKEMPKGLEKTLSKRMKIK